MDRGRLLLKCKSYYVKLIKYIVCNKYVLPVCKKCYPMKLKVTRINIQINLCECDMFGYC